MLLILPLALICPVARTQGLRVSQPEGIVVSGTVTDPSGAVIPDATVLLEPVAEGPHSAVEDNTFTGPTGWYRVHGVPGTYSMIVEANGFARFQSEPFELRRSTSPLTLDVRMKLEVQIEQIDVPGESVHSGYALVLSARDVETMPADSAALLDEFQSLAGSKDAELFVDGFSGARLPPRANIREVRINQNPYSAQNDTNPVNGIIQVSTKPGTGQVHGEFYAYGDDSSLDARNPFTPNQAPFYSVGTGGLLNGPLNHRSSYSAGWDQLNLRNNSNIEARTLDASLNQTQLSYAVPSPRSTLNISPRLDLRVSPDSTMIFRYSYDHNSQSGGGIGPLSLASQAYRNSTDTQTVQLSNTQVVTEKVVNETRLQFVRMRSSQTPDSIAPTIVVQGAFVGGGSNAGLSRDHQDRIELQNYASFAKADHYFNAGIRVRVARDANFSQANYNGQYTFSSLAIYQYTLQQMQAGRPMPQILTAGGGASQFTINAGAASAAVTIADTALFLQDDWKLHPNLTLSAGLRFETQTYIADHADWAPRLGFSWAPTGKGKNPGPRFVLHGGAGIFYRRFGIDPALQVDRQNGTNQQEYIVTAPGFFSATQAPPAASLTTQASLTTYRVSPDFHAPYFIGSTIAIDRRLGRYGTVSLTYLNNRGVHGQLTENINAPLPGTYIPGIPGSGTRPLGGNEDIYEFVSAGVSRSSRLSTNLNLRFGSRFALFGYYMLRFDRNDADLAGGFPSIQTNLGADYGRSSGDTRHTASLVSTVNLISGFHASGFVRAISGAPFNIVLGQDLTGNTQFTSRPAFATDLTRPSVVATRWGTFDTSPMAGQTIIPRNYGQGPGLFLVDLALGKSFGIGPVQKPAAATSAKAPKTPVAHRYTLDFWAESQNLLNHPNLAPPVGVLGSPLCPASPGVSLPSGSQNCSLFGRSLTLVGPSSLSQDRIVDLQLSLRF